VLFGTLLTVLVTAQQPALAQLGPWVEITPQPDKAPTQAIHQTASQSQARPNHQIQSSATDASDQQIAKQLSSDSKPLGLPRDRVESLPIGNDEVKTPMVLGKEFIRSVAALAGVLLLIFALAHFYKRLARAKGGLSGQMGAGGRAPAGLVEVLGRYPISSGMTLVVLRFDRKVLLLSHAGSGRGKKSVGGGTMQTLCEVGGAEDVASILGKVRDEAGDSIAASFERTLQEAGNATDQEISKAMYQPAPGVHVKRPRRVAPGFVSNDEGDRLELTSLNDSPAASQVLRRRLGAMRRGR
jgi:hypothetical protein